MCIVEVCNFLGRALVWSASDPPESLLLDFFDKWKTVDLTFAHVIGMILSI